MKHGAPQVPEPSHSKTPSWVRAVRAVAWSFLGIRKKSEYQEDLAKVSPLHLILIGLLGALGFVLTLVVIVNWVVAK